MNQVAIQKTSLEPLDAETAPGPSGRRLHAVSGRWKLGLALALTTAMLWGTLPVVLKVLVGSMAAPTVVWYRFLVASLLIGIFLRFKGWIPSLRGLGRLEWVLLVAACLGLVGNNVIFVFALNYISPSTGQVVIQLAPVFLLAGAVIIFRERMHFAQWIGLAVILAGLALFFNQRLGDLARPGVVTWGLGLVLIAAVLWAGYALAQKQLLTHFPSIAIMWMLYGTSAVLLTPLASPSEITRLDGFELLLLLYCCVNTVTGYGAFAESLAHWDASRVGAVLATTPVLTIMFTGLGARLFPAYIAPERLNAWSVAGACAVVAGSMVSALVRSGSKDKGAE